MFTPTRINDRSRDLVEDNQPIIAVLHVVPRDKEHRSAHFRNFDLPVPEEPADLLFAAVSNRIAGIAAPAENLLVSHKNLRTPLVQICAGSPSRSPGVSGFEMLIKT